MKLELKHIFVILAIVSVWLWAKVRWPEYLGAEWAAILVTILAAAGSSWMTMTAAFAALFCMLELQTCACGHLSSWQALAVTSSSMVLAWYAIVDTHKRGEKRDLAIAICVATLASCMCVNNLEDLFIRGHHPIWRDSPFAGSLEPSIGGTLSVVSIFASIGAALCVIAFNLYTWCRGKTDKTGAQAVLPAASIAGDSNGA